MIKNLTQVQNKSFNKSVIIKNIQNKSLTFRLENFGCQMNVADAIETKNLLKKNGFRETTEEIPNIIILNSCAIRETSENRIYAKLREYASFKKEYPLVIVLTGCVAQKEGKRVLEKVPEVNLIIGTHEKYRIHEILKNYFEEEVSIYSSIKGTYIQKPKSEVFDSLGGYQFTESVKQKNSPFKADIIIIHGCNKFCSYCIVPYTRGEEMSQPSIKIIEEAKKLVDKGVTEICLLGQNVNSYGKDIQDISFSELLYKLNEIGGLRRIRFITSHPMDFTNELIDSIAECKNVCKYIHLPIQSASNSVLKRMRREYTYEHYLSIIERLRKKVHNLVLSTDILVGFCGETEDDFKKTYYALDQIRYDHAYMFKYSVRRGSESEKYTNDVHEEEKKRRLQLIIKRQHTITNEINLTNIGKIEEVLFENSSRNNPDDLIGKTDGNKPVVCKLDKSYIGKYVKVKLCELKGNTFIGNLI